MFDIRLEPHIQDFITIFLGILVEAIPFIILGSIVGALINTFVRDQWMLRAIPKNRFLAHLLMPFLGVLFPVCECGNVPVAKRLFYKGVPSSQIMTFLLAAPAFNPIVFLSTYSAFKASLDIVAYRFAFTYFIAVLIGILLSYKQHKNDFLENKFAEDVSCHKDHKHKSIKHFISDVVGDFGNILPTLAFGAIIAAGLQSFVPLDILRTIGQDPILSILVMMLIAFVISICSNVDAFVALSYTSRFTSGSIVAFLVFGPMIDIKSLSMMSKIFNKKFLILITVLVVLCTFLLSLVLNYYVF